MNVFGERLREFRIARGLSLRSLGELASYNYSHLSQVENGRRSPSDGMARACDRALDADGELIAAFERQTGGDEMRRRVMLRTMSALAGAAAVPAVGWEALRHGLGAAAGGDVDEWREIVAGYGVDYYRLTADELMTSLRRDLDVLGHQIAASDGSQRQRLLGVAGMLSLLVALEMVSAGEQVSARRWWSTARRQVAESGDEGSRLWVRGWDAVNGCYDGRTVASLPGSVDALPPVAVPTAAGCQVLGGYAQALSLAGRHGEAVEVVERLTDMAGRLPVGTPDGTSLWGWSDTRTAHTRSWVMTAAGRWREAERAQDQALALYPPEQRRLRSMVELHRAAGMVGSGDVSGGLAYAGSVLDALPVGQHNRLVRFVTSRVVEAVPVVERSRPAVRELVARAAV